MFRPLSEAFIRRSWYSVLPVLDTTGRRSVKKAVVCVAQLVAALITVHGLLSFLSDVYGSYQLSHAYDRFFDTASSRCVKNRKN